MIAARSAPQRGVGRVVAAVQAFAGFALLGAALVALAATFEPGRAAAWARIGLAGAVAGVAVAAALQAVDGIALKVTVDRWAAATGDVRAVVYEAALAVRQIEIGLAALLSVTTGLALIAFSFAMLVSMRYPHWVGVIGLLDGLGMAAAGGAQASSGFSALAMTIRLTEMSPNIERVGRIFGKSLRRVVWITAHWMQQRRREKHGRPGDSGYASKTGK
jgi:hypothetical protein